MTDYGEAIIERLPRTSGLKNKDNPAYTVIDTTIGAWLTEHTGFDWFSQFFIQDATGPYLDLHGRDAGLMRKIDETDDKFRQRIIYERMGHLTSKYLIDVYNVELYNYESDYDSETMLLSDNEYISSNGFYGKTDETTEAILNKKFVIGDAVTWL